MNFINIRLAIVSFVIWSVVFLVVYRFADDNKYAAFLIGYFFIYISGIIYQSSNLSSASKNNQFDSSFEIIEFGPKKLRVFSMKFGFFIVSIIFQLILFGFINLLLDSRGFGDLSMSVFGISFLLLLNSSLVCSLSEK